MFSKINRWNLYKYTQREMSFNKKYNFKRVQLQQIKNTVEICNIKKNDTKKKIILE